MRLVLSNYSRVGAQEPVTVALSSHWVAACMSGVHQHAGVYPGVYRRLYTREVYQAPIPRWCIYRVPPPIPGCVYTRYPSHTRVVYTRHASHTQVIPQGILYPGYTSGCTIPTMVGTPSAHSSPC